MPQPNDLSRSLAAFDEDSTLIAVIEMSQSSGLVAGVIPGVERHPTKKLQPDAAELLRLLHRWRAEAEKASRNITRITVAFEAGRDGFWLARWLLAHDVEAYVIHPNSIAVSREHRRAKTDRLDTALLKRAFLGWLRGEREHCSMAAIPSLKEEDAKRPGRERESLVGERTRSRARWHGSVSAASSQPCAREPSSWNGCARQRANRCRPTPWPSCGRWLACACSPSRSGRSRPRASNGWNSNRTRALIQCSGCWRGSEVLASRPQTCSPARRFPARCATAGR
jgi:hypothetical protein